MTRGNRAIRSLALFASLAALSLFDHCQADEARRPNLLLIVSDNQPYEDLGCNGNSAILTPRLDHLAAEGMRLTDFCVASAMCTPSRAAILTGRYPLRNGLYDMIRNDDAADYGCRMTEIEYAVSPEMTLGLDPREILVAQPLHAAGYATGVIGKWDSGRARRFLPLQRGFDFFYGFACTGVDYWTHERYGIPSLFRGNDRIAEDGYTTDLFCREALRFIDDHRDRPWFLYLPFNACHGASSFDRAGPQAPDETLSLYPSKLNAKTRARYASLTRMDEAIGKILDRLDALRLADNTLVLFFSDNGRLNSFAQSGLRVPFVARWPGRIPAGAVRNEFVTSFEIFPTLLVAAKVEVPTGLHIDGFDMLPMLGDHARSPRREMAWHERDRSALRVGNIKWIETPAGSTLFDLGADPNEQHDLSATRPELVAEMRARFTAWRNELEACEPRGPFRDY
ncbi:MAG TPA: sulfatase-like hydrolase/transferase [Pirellulales bacterium]|nr:sulfatase-like hydrolase/transferase [Pirellulales bacterium]